MFSSVPSVPCEKSGEGEAHSYYFGSRVGRAFEKTYFYISDVLSASYQRIYALFANAVAWAASFRWGTSTPSATHDIHEIDSSLAQRVDKPFILSGVKAVAENVEDKILSYVAQKVILEPLPEEKQMGPLALKEVSEIELQTKFSGSCIILNLLEKCCSNYAESGKLLESTKTFFHEFKKKICCSGAVWRRELIADFISHRGEIESFLSAFNKPSSANTIAERKSVFFSEAEIDGLKEHLFGADFIWLASECAPIADINVLQQYLAAFQEEGACTENEFEEILSGILTELTFWVDQCNNPTSPHSYNILSSHLEFIRNQHGKGVILPIKRQPENLFVEYDSEDEEGEEPAVDNFSKLPSDPKIYHEKVVDFLNKHLALCDLEEYASQKFEPKSFLEMILRVDACVGEIDSSHKLYMSLQNAFNLLIIKFTDSDTVYHTFDLNKLKGPYSLLAGKLGVVSADESALFVTLSTDGDIDMSNKVYQDDLDALYQDDLALAWRLHNT